MRIVQIPIAYDVLKEIFITGWNGNGVKCIQGLPEGARLIRSFPDIVAGTCVLIFEHESFNEVPLGEYPPTLHCLFQKCVSDCACEATE